MTEQNKVAEPYYHYVIYDHPKDYPDDFVVRRHSITKDGAIPEKELFMSKKYLTDIREELKKIGLFPIARHPEDDIVIVETWL